MLDDFRKLCLPYCVVLRPDGLWLLVNRNYQPIGDPSRPFSSGRTDWKDCKGLPFKVARLRRALDKICVSHMAMGPDGEQWWLYDDVTIPTDGAANWEAYSKKLKALASMRSLRVTDRRGG